MQSVLSLIVKTIKKTNKNSKLYKLYYFCTFWLVWFVQFSLGVWGKNANILWRLSLAWAQEVLNIHKVESRVHSVNRKLLCSSFVPHNPLRLVSQAWVLPGWPGLEPDPQHPAGFWSPAQECAQPPTSAADIPPSAMLQSSAAPVASYWSAPLNPCSAVS